MAVRRVEIRLMATDEDARRVLDEFRAKLDELEKRRPTVKLGLDLGDAGLKLQRFSAQLDLLGGKDVKPKVQVEGIAESLAAVTVLETKLDALGHKSVSARVSTSGTASSALRTELRDLSAFSRTLGGAGTSHTRADRLLSDVKKMENDLALAGSLEASAFTHTRRGRATSTGWFRSLLGGIFGLGGGGGSGGGGASAAEGAAGKGGGGIVSSILSSLAGASNSVTGGLIAGAIGLAGSIAPAVIPFGLGGLVGGGAAAGGIALGAHLNTQLTALQSAVSSAQSTVANARLSVSQATTATSRAHAQQRLNLDLQRLHSAQADLHSFQSKNAPALSVYSGAMGVVHGAEGAFMSALTSRGAPHIGSVGHLLGETPGAPSFLQGLSGILKQIGGFVKSIGPELGQMFRASVPFVSAFAKILEQLAKELMPALTQSMVQLKPYLPQIMQGFKYLSQGIADFIKDLGPGMKDSVVVFKAVMDGVKGVMIGLAYTADGLAKAFRWIGHHAILSAAETHRGWDILRHWTAHTFDLIRHDVASAWDWVWSHSIGAVIHGVNTVDRWFRTMDLRVIGWMKRLPGEMANLWDTAWRHSIGAVIHGIGSVVGWVRQVPHRVTSALGNLGSLLWNAGNSILQGFLNGLESKWHAVTGFIGGIAEWIKKNKGPIEADRLLLVPHGQAIMGGLLTGMIDGFQNVQAFTGSAAAQIASAGRAGAYAAGGGGSARLEMVVSPGPGMDSELTAALLQWLRFEVRTKGGGNVQALLGRP